MRISNFLISILVFLMSIFIYFGYLFNNSYPLFYFAFLINIVIIIIFKRKLKINKYYFAWLLLGLILLIGSIYSKVPNNALSFSISFILVILFSFNLSNIPNDSFFKKFINLFLIFGLIHVLATLYYSINPSSMQVFLSKILKPNDYAVNLFLFNHGGNPGITGQTGINGWFISVTIGVLFFKLFNGSSYSFIKKLIYIILIIFSIVALVLTSKRSFIIISIVSILYILLSKESLSLKKKIFFLFLISIIFGIMFYITSKSVIFQSIFDRFVDNGVDISSGRFSIYSLMFSLFFKYPILGIGTESTLFFIGDFGHNIYLQILTENGFLALFYFIGLILMTFSQLKLIKENKENCRCELNIVYYVLYLFFLYGFTGNSLYTIQEYTTLFIIIGYVNFSYMEVKQNEK